jgi:hypothetical protein
MIDPNSQAISIRSMHPDDWLPAHIEPWKYANSAPLTGFRRRDLQGGNPLHPVPEPESDTFEREVAERLQHLRSSYRGAIAKRRHIHMPYWTQEPLPKAQDYTLVEAPKRLTTTSVTIVLVPNEPARGARMGFYFQGTELPTLRARMKGSRFQGLVGNLGYFMTPALIEGTRWSHNLRYPGFPLPKMPSYIGFHLWRDVTTRETYSSFQGAHPAAVAVRRDGAVEILSDLRVERYQVRFGGSAGIQVDIEEINPSSPTASVTLFTPAFQGTREIQQLIAATEKSTGTDDSWQHCTPMIPGAGEHRRLNVFIANQGNGKQPIEKVVALWDGPSPLPSYGGLLSFDRAAFKSLFGSGARFQREFVGSDVQIVPCGIHPDLEEYDQIMGGFVPAIVDHEHVYHGTASALQIMKGLSRFGATSPVAQCGRETANFDLRVREPAGVLLQTNDRIGWALFDGRHEMSIGASIVDAAAILNKLEDENEFGGRVRHAFFVDGGSAMKVYHIVPGQQDVSLDLLNRAAAGSRNGPGADPEGLNLYTSLNLQLDTIT